MRRLLVILGCLAASGCISHRARVSPPAGEPASALVGSRVIERFTAPVDEQGSLPRSIPVTAWRLDDQGLFRGDTLVETPLPWWQRFPIDAVSDVVVPGTLTARAEGTPVLAPVPAGDPAALADHARAAGYAGPAGHRTHHP
jgi:hypothetical protein